MRAYMRAGMCGRFSQTADPSQIAAKFGLYAMPEEGTKRANIAPTQPVAMVGGDDPARARLARWGLVPGWAKDERTGGRFINARVETVATRSPFAELFADP